GADANPYLALAALLAAALDGIEHQIEPPPAFSGDAYSDGTIPHIPRSLPEAIAAFEHSDLARRAFGDAVVEHYLHFARTEQQAFEATVTCWERQRYFERI
ncbi:MAG: glutamine synthetase, partial [Chloroflexi bacterium]|nr:glutamine synthetase [Chloroflexota bacterium]